MKTSGWARYAIAMVVGMGMIHLDPAHAIPAHAIPLVDSDSCCIASQAGQLMQKAHYDRHYYYYGYPRYRDRNYYSDYDDYYYRPYYRNYYSDYGDYYYRPYRHHYYGNYYRYPYYGHHHYGY
jgi:hypothetical protein